MNEFEKFNASQQFDELDLNKDQCLDREELHLVHLKFFFIDNKDLTAKKIELSKQFMKHLRKCQSSSISSSSSVTRDDFFKCESLLAFLETSLWNQFDRKARYKFEVLGEADSKFLAMSGLNKDLKSKLDSLLLNPAKFICLNDDIDYTSLLTASRIKKQARQFYMKLFPQKSAFEIASKRLF
jgi:hypothetical protein